MCLIYVIDILKFYRRGHVPCRNLANLGWDSPDSDFRICPPLYLTYAVSNYNEYRPVCYSCRTPAYSVSHIHSIHHMGLVTTKPVFGVCDKVRFKPVCRELSGKVLDSRPKGSGFKPHQRHCVVVIEQDTFILA